MPLEQLIAALNDTRLSWEARGLLAFMDASRGWRRTVDDLVSCGPADRKQVERMLQELDGLGYMERRQDD